MGNEKYILIDEGFQQKVLQDLSELKQFVLQISLLQVRAQSNDLMDTADLIQYLKVDRRTIYKHRLSGML